MINGEEYSFEDISLIVDGETISGFQGIEYTTSKEHYNMTGKGNKPTGIRRGKESYTASLDVMQSTLEMFQRRLAPGRKITDMRPFTIIVAYAPEGGVVTVDRLEFCRVLSVQKGLKTDSGEQGFNLPLLPGDIKYNV